MDFYNPEPYSIIKEPWMLDYILTQCKLKEDQVHLCSHVKSNKLEIDLNTEKGSLILDHLKDAVYPYGKPVVDYWMKEYNPGQYAAMHYDGFYEAEQVLYSTSILIESNNVEGGEYIMGSDFNYNTHKWLKHRLKYYNVKTPGLGISWTQFTYHGITEITSGVRKTLMVAKKSDMLWKDIENVEEK